MGDRLKAGLQQRFGFENRGVLKNQGGYSTNLSSRGRGDC